MTMATKNTIWVIVTFVFGDERNLDATYDPPGMINQHPLGSKSRTCCGFILHQHSAMAQRFLRKSTTSTNAWFNFHAQKPNR
jgi:hypothetical protein